MRQFEIRFGCGLATLLVVAALAATSATGQGIALLKDVNKSPWPSTLPRSSDPGAPGGIVKLGSVLLFPARSAALGRELYKTGGTPATTGIVKDIAPGIPGSSPDHLFAFGNVCLFSAKAGNTGCELWRTDGTTAGTVLVKDIVAGPMSSNPQAFTGFASSVYFITATTSPELWKTDGTSAGTTRVATIQAGMVLPPKMVATGSHLFFTTATAIWISDGTAAGTRSHSPKG